MADRLDAFNGDESLRAPEPFCVRLRALNAVKALDLSPLILDNIGRGRPVLFDLRDLLLTELPMAPRTPSRGGKAVGLEASSRDRAEGWLPRLRCSFMYLSLLP